MTFLSVFLSALSVLPGAAQAAVPATKAVPAAVEKSTGGAHIRTIEDIYWGAKYRTPFQKSSAGRGGGGTAAEIEFSMEDFSIHELDLKGVLRDKAGAFAILVDPRSGTGFILRKGRLFDYKSERVRGIVGTINMAQKTVQLITREKDTQTLRLGEDEEEAELGEEGKEETAP